MCKNIYSYDIIWFNSMLSFLQICSGKKHNILKLDVIEILAFRF